jgi:hypothetical protein
MSSAFCKSYCTHVLLFANNYTHFLWQILDDPSPSPKKKVFSPFFPNLSHLNLDQKLENHTTIYRINFGQTQKLQIIVSLRIKRDLFPEKIKR